jgi:hypothetical protein
VRAAFTAGFAVWAASAPVVAQTAGPEWSCSALAYTYIVPDAANYLQPTFIADREDLHLEARYSYEDRKTGSLWAGYNISVGEELAFEMTPMLGAVFGRTSGIAPGYKASLNYRQVELSTEAEYVIDTGNADDSFFYNWTELSYAPIDPLRVGLVIQRTKVYQTDFDIQRGFLVGISYKRVEFTTYVFNPDDEPTVVLGFAVQF